MSTDVLALTLVANQQATLGQGRMFYIKSASGPMTIVTERAGSQHVDHFNNIGPGFKYKDSGGGWTFLRIVSPTNQNIEIILGDDDVEVANAVSVTGNVLTQINPSTAITVSGADTVIANAAAFAVPANAGRRRITVGNLSTNAGSVRLQSTGAGANKGLELQPGTFVELDTTAAFDVRNDSGAACSVYFLEEA